MKHDEHGAFSGKCRYPVTRSDDKGKTMQKDMPMGMNPSERDYPTRERNVSWQNCSFQQQEFGKAV